MLEAFLLRAGFLGLKNWIWIAIVSVVVAASATLIAIADNAEKRKLDMAKEAGAAGAIIKGQETTLDQLKDANNAEKDLNAGGERSLVRFDECLRNSRIRKSCERYRPIAD